MLNILKFLLKPLKTEYLMVLFAMKSIVMIFSICCLMAVVNAAATQQQPQSLNYKQQLQYQMQQHDKFEYQQHMKQQQQFYQQQYHQQQAPTSMELLQEQQQQEQQQKQRLQRQQQQYLAMKPSQMLQIAESMLVDDGIHMDALTLGQPEYSNGNVERKRLDNRKRRSQQLSTDEGYKSQTASNSPLYWKNQTENVKQSLNITAKFSAVKHLEADKLLLPSLQAFFKRRKQLAISEPLEVLGKEQKRNNPETITNGNINQNLSNLKNLGIIDNLNIRKRARGLNTSTTETTTTSTTPKLFTTRTPLYKRILNRSLTMKPTSFLKNITLMVSAEPEKLETSRNEEPANMKENENDRQLCQDGDRNSLSTYRYTKTPSTTTSTSIPTFAITTTPLPMTTSASSSSINLRPKANLNLKAVNTLRIKQETLPTNLIEKEDSFKKSQPSEQNHNTGDNNLKNLFKEQIKPKITKYFKTSTATTGIKQISPASTSLAVTSNLPTDSLNVIPDFDNENDRTDILDLIEDRETGDILFNLIEQSNMTLEELIEQRERGSTQLHFNTVVESNSHLYSDKNVVPQYNMDIVTAIENLPHFNLLNVKSLEKDNIEINSQNSQFLASIIDTKSNKEE